MYDKFKVLLKATEYIGEVIRIQMFDSVATIDIVDKDGNQITITVSIKEETKNDTV